MTTPWRKQILGAVAAGIGVGAVAWAVGVTVRHAVLIGIILLAIVPLLSSAVEPGDVLPRLPPRVRHGARTEVSRLSWAMAGRRRGRVEGPVVRRLRAIAARRLADVRIDISDPAHQPAAERALGAWAYSVVVGEQADLGRTEVSRLVDAIERLGDLRIPGSAVRPDGSNVGTVRRSRS